MTIESGANEIKNNDDNSIYNVAKQFSRGMLMGARGNSGVILSQFFRGIYKGLAGYDKVNAVELAAAFESGVAQAYKAVMKPRKSKLRKDLTFQHCLWQTRTCWKLYWRNSRCKRRKYRLQRLSPKHF